MTRRQALVLDLQPAGWDPERFADSSSRDREGLHKGSEITMTTVASQPGDRDEGDFADAPGRAVAARADGNHASSPPSRRRRFEAARDLPSDQLWLPTVSRSIPSCVTPEDQPREGNRSRNCSARSRRPPHSAIGRRGSHYFIVQSVVRPLSVSQTERWSPRARADCETQAAGRRHRAASRRVAPSRLTPIVFKIGRPSDLIRTYSIARTRWVLPEAGQVRDRSANSPASAWQAVGHQGQLAA